jgi:hypothetical protein
MVNVCISFAVVRSHITVLYKNLLHVRTDSWNILSPVLAVLQCSPQAGEFCVHTTMNIQESVLSPRHWWALSVALWCLLLSCAVWSVHHCDFSESCNLLIRSLCTDSASWLLHWYNIWEPCWLLFGSLDKLHSLIITSTYFRWASSFNLWDLTLHCLPFRIVCPRCSSQTWAIQH